MQQKSASAKCGMVSRQWGGTVLPIRALNVLFHLDDESASRIRYIVPESLFARTDQLWQRLGESGLWPVFRRAGCVQRILPHVTHRSLRSVLAMVPSALPITSKV
jgi:hypothetical protein